MILPANLLTGAKHAAFSTNHLTDIDYNTKYLNSVNTKTTQDKANITKASQSLA